MTGFGGLRACLLAVLLAFTATASAQFTVSNIRTVSEKRVGRTTFEYTLRADLTNSGPAAIGIVAKATSNSPSTTIAEDALTFGTVANAATAPSIDTITIVHDRTVPFEPAVLQWTFSTQPPAPAVSRSSAPTMATAADITGTTAPGAAIEIVGGSQTVTGTASPAGAFSVSTPLLQNRINKLFVTAIGAAGQRSAPVPVDVIQDAQPPSLFIDFPADGAQLTNDSIVVAGRVGDMLSGFQGLSVSVNGQPAGVNIGIGNNGTYQRAIPLALGANTIAVSATDIGGNSAPVKQITVHRSPITGPSIAAVSGDMQTAPMHGRLPQPIVVKIANADGSPIAGKVATFNVIRSDGRLVADPAAAAPGAMTLQVATDAGGLARAWWNVGADAGQANNRVAVTGQDIAGTAFFCASGTPGPPHQVNIGTGNNQRCEAGGPAFEPLRAWVSDMCNGIANLPVTFTVRQGGGKVNGADAATVNTSITGHAEVALTLGPDPGQNVIEANYPGNPNLPATFIAYGVARDLGKPTTFTGLVLDNTSNPIGGATCRLEVSGQSFTTTSDPQGRFAFGPSTINNQLSTIPAGAAHLYVDGLTATQLNGANVPPGTFPPLGYLTTIIPNAENSLPTPVLLPCMNVNNAKTYNGTTDLVLTCEGIAGLKMTIKANSMRHPDGTPVTPARPAVVSLNQVHHDQIPMPMPDGASPPFAWTLQPGGAHFDPPIAIEYPNMSGLPPGAIAYFLSFNHDTERFEIVASGHVTGDGSTILSDSGAGLSIAGWGCNCPPYAVTGNCDNRDPQNPPRPEECVLQLAVDADRDGIITSDAGDLTTAEKPFEFWINNDSDTEGVLENDTANGPPDYIDGRLSSKRDLEDLFRLEIKLCPSLRELLKHGATLAIEANGARVNLYKAASDGLAYLREPAQGALQIRHSYIFGTSTYQHADAVNTSRIAYYLTEEDYVRGRALLLVEGASAGLCELRVVLRGGGP